ncbi:hypothetical protein M758_8G146100, partial [Ceratodon purpureus]|uniref:Uncharacterized protein n=1 Tax=Ceratodon purpureus TaxID=3225 RepID=A0A8T0H760_CERPU
MRATSSSKPSNSQKFYASLPIPKLLKSYHHKLKNPNGHSPLMLHSRGYSHEPAPTCTEVVKLACRGNKKPFRDLSVK